MKAIYFDMDGTIADLYGYDGWLEMLQAENTEPYEKCGVLVDAEELRDVLCEFMMLGVKIGVISWSAMNGSKDYNRRTRKAKKDWCNEFFADIFTEFHVVKYGTPKHRVANEKDSILVDDNAEVRAAWNGLTIDANEDIILALKQLLVALHNSKTEKNNRGSSKMNKAEQQGLFSDLFKSHRTNGSGVYLIGNTTFNPITKEERYWVKVGKATTLNQRINQYLTHAPDIYFIDWRPTRKDLLTDYENRYHSQLELQATYNRTEWFKVDKKTYFEICEKGFQYFD